MTEFEEVHREVVEIVKQVAPHGVGYLSSPLFQTLLLVRAINRLTDAIRDHNGLL